MPRRTRRSLLPSLLTALALLSLVGLGADAFAQGGEGDPPAKNRDFRYVQGAKHFDEAISFLARGV